MSGVKLGVPAPPAPPATTQVSPAPAPEIICVGVEITDYAAQIVAKVEILATTLEDKLMPIMLSSIPVEGNIPQEDSREYPPMFSDLRYKFDEIQEALERIKSCIERTELP